MLSKLILLVLAAFSALATAIPVPEDEPNTQATDRLVFCHFMVSCFVKNSGLMTANAKCVDRNLQQP